MVVQYEYRSAAALGAVGRPSEILIPSEGIRTGKGFHHVPGMDRYEVNTSHFGLGSTSHPSLRPRNSLRKHVHTGVVDGIGVAT